MSTADADSYLGTLDDVVAGRWLDPTTGKAVSVPIEQLVIADDLAGREAELVHSVHGDAKICVVADQTTWEILGKRVHASLQSRGSCMEHVLTKPASTWETVEQLREATADADALVAVGSGTITDLVKHASFLSDQKFSVFATSPMNAYTTRSASITVDGTKKSLPSHAATGVFFELKTAASCSDRLIANALADVVCRSSAQVDWLLSRDFTGSSYSDLPYQLLEQDEDKLLKSASSLLSRDHDVIATLIRTCVANGLGSMVTNSTHCGSMAEHSISHFLDMNAGSAHPGSLHGEQVGVTTLTVMRLQEQILLSDSPPQLAPTVDYTKELEQRYGQARGAEYAQVAASKSISEDDADAWNSRWAVDWTGYAETLRAGMQPADEVEQALRDAGAAVRATELGFDPDFYRQAVRDARHLRNRFSILDIAGDAGLLDSFVASMEV